jgi:hypothetical protein
MTPSIEVLALRLWRERELDFPPRVRRMTPDDFDHASGAWDRMLAEARRLSQPDLFIEKPKPPTQEKLSL